MDRERFGRIGKGWIGKGKEWDGREGLTWEGKGWMGKGKEWDGREGMGRIEKKREIKRKVGRKDKGRNGKAK